MTGYGRRAGDPKGATKEMEVAFPQSAVMQALVGDKDENLRTIERELGLKIGRSANGLTLVGQDTDVELGHDLLTQLRDLVQSGENVFKGDVERAIKMLSGNRRLRLEDLFRDEISEVASAQRSSQRRLGRRPISKRLKITMLFSVLDPLELERHT